MALPDYPSRVPSMDELVACGATRLSVFAIEFDPPPMTGRGLTGKEKPVKWKGVIEHASAAKPTVFAIRKTAKEADDDVRRGFWQHHSSRPHKYPPPDKPLDFPHTPKAAAPEDDFSDVI
jgi:hypothetical protein